MSICSISTLLNEPLEGGDSLEVLLDSNDSDASGFYPGFQHRFVGFYFIGIRYSLFKIDMSTCRSVQVRLSWSRHERFLRFRIFYPGLQLRFVAFCSFGIVFLCSNRHVNMSLCPRFTFLSICHCFFGRYRYICLPCLLMLYLTVFSFLFPVP